ECEPRLSVPTAGFRKPASCSTMRPSTCGATPPFSQSDERQRFSVFRYVAFVWDDFDLAARERADLLAQRLRDISPEWQQQVDARGARVYCAGVRPGASEPRVLHGGRGVVLGTLFQRDADSPSQRAPLVFSEEESRKIHASSGRRLVSGYWGRYVAVLHD